MPHLISEVPQMPSSKPITPQDFNPDLWINKEGKCPNLEDAAKALRTSIETRSDISRVNKIAGDELVKICMAEILTVTKGPITLMPLLLNSNLEIIKTVF